jgi:4-hydroxy-tetrahydrodipicolinate synthase
MTKKKVFSGCCTALITPFQTDGAIDYASLERLIEFQIENGVNALLALGTTGEPATMTDAEKREVLRFVKDKINGRVPYLAGTGGNNTEKVIEDSRYAEESGADGLVVVTPYYNKCTQNGLVAHYGKLAESVGVPVLLYNVPSRTGVNVLPSTLEKLSRYANINGIKEACGSFEQVCESINVCRADGLHFYAGDDLLTFPAVMMGADGVISVTANVIPAFMSELCRLSFTGETSRAREMHAKLVPFVKAVFIEVNPIPVKAAAEKTGLCGGTLRLPLTEIEPANREKLYAELAKFI